MAIESSVINLRHLPQKVRDMVGRGHDIPRWLRLFLVAQVIINVSVLFTLIRLTLL